MLKFTTSRIAAVLLAATTLVACGDDEPMEIDMPVTIAQTAIATADLSTLSAALQAAGLVSTLEGTGPFTVFAPRNAAFDALGADVVAGLLEDGNLDVLSRVLTFHVVQGSAAFAEDLSDGQTFTTVEGGSVEVGVSATGVTVNGASVITADVEASNGVVHIIDAVLVPETDVYETALLTGGTTTLASAVLAAGLDAALQADGPFTVFAPVNSAFDAVDAYTLDQLLAEDNVDILAKVLTYHVIEAEVLASGLSDGLMVETLQGQQLTFDLSDASDPKVNGVSITATDIEVGNGVIHLVDGVLLPEFNVVETAIITEGTGTLATAVGAADLATALSADGPFTVFAPIDAAFEAVDGYTLDQLLASDNQAILQKVLTYHVVEGEVPASALSDGMTAMTLQGQEIVFDLSDAMDPKVNGTSIIATDIEVENGVIHLVDGVLLPEFDIVETAVITEGTGTLATAVAAGELVDALQADGPFTVFAPIDAAFEALGTDRLDVLLDPANIELLQKVLTYHVVEGAVPASALSDGMTVETLQGSEVTFDLSDAMDPKVNGISIIATDIETENGVIHLIDGVLTQHLDLVDVATVEGFSTLVSLVDQQALTETLRGDNMGDGYTVFAPTDEAFAALASVPSGDDLTNVLLYHVVAASVESSTLTDGQVVATAFAGHDFTVNIGGSGVTITDENANVVNVTVTDVVAANGIIHVIDAVLLPTP